MSDAAELIDMLRAVIGLKPIPEEHTGYSGRKRCERCGRKHRCQRGDLCARCAGIPAGFGPRKPSTTSAAAG